MNPNASRLNPQKLRFKGLPLLLKVKQWEEWCDLETVGAEELGEKESDREGCILGRES